MQPHCTCTAKCEAPDCSGARPVGTCQQGDVQAGAAKEKCGNGLDDNCDGAIDEGCDAPSSGGAGGPGGDKDDKCGGSAGDDPIVLASRSAVTEPFTDFSVDGFVPLGMARTYTSADVSVGAGAASPGIFGRGWHHQWEAALTCAASSPGFCTVTRGLLTGMSFKKVGSAQPVGAYASDAPWDIFTRIDGGAAGPPDRSVLVKRPGTSGYILFQTNGFELHFATVCDCAGESTCTAPSAGGRARLVRVVDPRGNKTSISYDRPNGVLLALSDDGGHQLSLKSGGACSATWAKELWYGADKWVDYEYAGTDGKELKSAKDRDGRVLRAYDYVVGDLGRLAKVRNEAGDPIVEFGYDASNNATTLVDPASTVAVEYGSGTAIVTSQSGAFGTRSTTLAFGPNARVATLNAPSGSSRVTWNGKRLKCVEGPLGHVDWYEHDDHMRLILHARYAPGAYSCSDPAPPVVPPLDEETYDYGLVRTVATGVDVELDSVVHVTRRSALANQLTGQAADDPNVHEWHDYDASSKAGDPIGYSCGTAGMVAGAAVCREITQGYTIDLATGLPVSDRHATYYSYDARGRLLRTEGPLSLDRPWSGDLVPVEVREYWPESETPERRGRLRYVRRYPGNGAPPLTTTIDYDALGVYQFTDPNGAIFTTVRDGRGRPSFKLVPGFPQTEIRYYDGLSPRLVLMPSGSVRRYTYDSRGRLRTVEPLSGDPDPAGAIYSVGWTERRSYDAAGNISLIEWLDATGAVRRRQARTSDEDHVLRSEQHPEDPTSQVAWGYDASGFLTDVTDELGRITEYVPDGLRRTQIVRKKGKDAAGLPVSLDVATYQFADGGSGLESVKDVAARTTTYTRDDFGQVVTVGNSATIKSSPIRYRFDARGNVVRRVHGTATVTYAYDGLDRLTRVDAISTAGAAPVTIVYTFDTAGDLGHLSSVSVTEKLGYVPVTRTTDFRPHDILGRVLRESISEHVTSAPPLVTSYTYDADGNLDTLVSPNGHTVKYVRDPATKAVTEVRNATSRAVYAGGVEHLPAGPIGEMTFGNGMTLSQAFNKRYEPSSIASGPLSLVYSMNKAGGVDAIAAGPVTTTYSYDILDQLVAVTPGDATGATPLTFEYVGDRVTLAWTAEAQPKRKYAFGYDDRSNLSAISAYDASGTSISTTYCLLHDALDRLVLVGVSLTKIGPDGSGCMKEADLSNPSGASTRLRYDEQNRRIAKLSPGRNIPWKYYAFSVDGNPTSEISRSLDGTRWSPLIDYIWLDGRPLAQLNYPGPSASYFHLDHIGMPRVMTGAGGAVVWKAETGPYGTVKETVTTVTTNLRLPGQYDERLLGTAFPQGPYYNWNRWYLPSVKGYMELDRIAASGRLNGVVGPDWYSYAFQNPMTYTDPSGLSPAPDWLDGLVRNRVADWIKKYLSPDYSSYAGALCIDSACRGGSAREYLEAYGDCVRIIGAEFKFPMGDVDGTDRYVNGCARLCRDVTHSGDFDAHCRRRSCQ